APLRARCRPAVRSRAALPSRNARHALQDQHRHKCPGLFASRWRLELKRQVAVVSALRPYHLDHHFAVVILGAHFAPTFAKLVGCCRAPAASMIALASFSPNSGAK